MQETVQLNADEWVDRYADALFHFAKARVKDGAVAEDLVQETFLAAVRSQARYKGKSSEKTWLFSILKHKIIDHYRKQQKMINVNDFIEDPDRIESFFKAKGSWQMRPAHWSSNPSKSHETREFLDHFFRCLAGLPKRTADAFAFREIDGLTTAEICKRLKITESNCWVILYRARMMLRKCLELVGYNPSERRPTP